jgi:hypothetical protein
MKRIRPLVLLLVTLAVPLGATVLIPTDLAELSRDADLIARGRVIATEARWSGDWRTIETLVTLESEAYLKGAAGPVVQFRVPGGQIGRYRRIFVGAPVFLVGQRVLVFLGDRAVGPPYPLGLSQGVFRIAAGSADWVITPTAMLPAERLPQTIGIGDTSLRQMRLEDFETYVRRLAGAQ